MRTGFAAARQVPAQQFTSVAINHQSQGRPAVLASPYPAHVCGPAFIGRLRHRGQGLDARPEADGPLAHLPTLKLENALHGVLVHAQQVRHRAIAEGR